MDQHSSMPFTISKTTNVTESGPLDPIISLLFNSLQNSDGISYSINSILSFSSLIDPGTRYHGGYTRMTKRKL